MSGTIKHYWERMYKCKYCSHVFEENERFCGNCGKDKSLMEVRVRRVSVSDNAPGLWNRFLDNQRMTHIYEELLSDGTIVELYRKIHIWNV